MSIIVPSAVVAFWCSARRLPNCCASCGLIIRSKYLKYFSKWYEYKSKIQKKTFYSYILFNIEYAGDCWDRSSLNNVPNILDRCGPAGANIAQINALFKAFLRSSLLTIDLSDNSLYRWAASTNFLL